MISLLLFQRDPRPWGVVLQVVLPRTLRNLNSRLSRPVFVHSTIDPRYASIFSRAMISELLCLIALIFLWFLGTGNGKPREGASNDLHLAAVAGSLRGVREALSLGSTDINQPNAQGQTPLIIAADRAHTAIVKLLLRNGASVSAVTNQGATALHSASLLGHGEVCQALIRAGSNLEARTTLGSTCLHLSAEHGHTRVVQLLLEAGESPNGRLPDGRTPLHIACEKGNVPAIRELLRWKANPLLTNRTMAVNNYVPLDMAVRHGRLEAVRELIQILGLDGCAGASGGVAALRLAAQNDHVDIMGVLAKAGVEDNGSALFGAIGFVREAPVTFLLQLRKRSTGSTTAYANTFGDLGTMMGTPLLVAIGFARHEPFPRIVEILIDAGADATSRVSIPERVTIGTPLQFVTRFINERKVDGKRATYEQLRKLEAIRLQLLSVEKRRRVPRS